MNFNKVFRTEENVAFTFVLSKEFNPEAKGNFITVLNNEPKAFIEGQEVEFPKMLINEIGVSYQFVNFYEHGLKMAKKHGVYYAVKQEPIRIWRHIKPGDVLKSVIDGFVEHPFEMPEGHLAAQNVVKNEFYHMSEEYLAEAYDFVCKEFDYELYYPKSDRVTKWAYSDINVFGVLWGSLEFLTTPMIRLDPNNSYGCNYVVWWGNDGRLASYRVVGYFRACGTKYYPTPVGEPVKVSEAKFEPPKELYA